ncbi:hypothetical protein Tco_0615291 [Tanacetum coccineum]
MGVVMVERSMALCSIGGVYVVRFMALGSIRGVLSNVLKCCDVSLNLYTPPTIMVNFKASFSGEHHEMLRLKRRWLESPVGLSSGVRSWSEVQAQIRRIFLDGYGVLVVRISFLHISSFKL